MSSSSLVSIIVPVYKIKTEYLRACVASLLRQTYENFEVILVDDGSPDDCGRICDECAAEDARISVIHQENSGVSAARNAGLDRAHGEYIVFADPDDYLEDVFLEQMLKQMPEDAQIISCCALIVGDDFTDTDHFFSGSRIFADDGNGADDGSAENEVCAYRKCAKNDLFLQLMDSHYGQPQRAYTAIGVPWGKIYRADFLKDNQLRFDTGLPRMQDNLFNMYAFCAARKIVYIDEPLYDYRYEHIHQFSAVKNRWYLETFHAVCTARQRCMRSTGLIEDEELKKAYEEELLSLLLSISYKGIFHSANGHSPAKKKEEWLELIRQPVYQDLRENFSPASRKNKIYLFMIRHHCFALMDLAMRRREWKEKVCIP